MRTLKTKLTLLLAILLFSSSLYGNSLIRNPRNTLFYNGFNAASWGEIGIDSGSMDDLNLFALRISFGVQLFRIQDYVSITGGLLASGLGGLSFPQEGE